MMDFRIQMIYRTCNMVDGILLCVSYTAYKSSPFLQLRISCTLFGENTWMKFKTNQSIRQCTSPFPFYAGPIKPLTITHFFGLFELIESRAPEIILVLFLLSFLLWFDFEFRPNLPAGRLHHFRLLRQLPTPLFSRFLYMQIASVCCDCFFGFPFSMESLERGDFVFSLNVSAEIHRMDYATRLRSSSPPHTLNTARTRNGLHVTLPSTSNEIQ